MTASSLSISRLSVCVVPFAALLSLGCGADDPASPGSGGSGNGSGNNPGTGASNGGGNETRTCGGESEHSGEGTYYVEADGGGNCMFDPTPNDLMVGAMNQTDYADSAVCGSCVELTGPSGTIKIRIVDRCPECKPGDIDLAPSAFDKIAAHELGRVPITWHVVECNVSGSFSYRYKEGSSQYWTGVQVRNHRHPIAKFEVKKGGNFVEIPRENYNYFVDGGGMGPGPYTFRITDVYGNAVEDSGIELIDATVVPGNAQFPVCD